MAEERDPSDIASTMEAKSAKKLLKHVSEWNTKAVDSMLKMGQANANGTLALRPLVCAVMMRDLVMVKLLVERGADVNAATPPHPLHWIRGEGGKVSEGETALHVACRNGHLPIVRFVLMAERGGKEGRKRGSNSYDANRQASRYM